jgi:short-subunit dehydrogenase involved in D-alanine esterification of teichoic acids
MASSLVALLSRRIKRTTVKVGEMITPIIETHRKDSDSISNDRSDLVGCLN